MTAESFNLARQVMNFEKMKCVAQCHRRQTEERRRRRRREEKWNMSSYTHREKGDRVGSSKTSHGEHDKAATYREDGKSREQPMETVGEKLGGSRWMILPPTQTVKTL